METIDDSKYSKKYSKKNFFNKLSGYAKVAGAEVVETALKLYYSAQSPDTPTWAKSTIYGALGYFIFPIDAIPDITPLIGYSDDLGVLAMALATVIAYIDEEVKKKAKSKMTEWFG
jgi:uncharacterized membrane protein YkvA (DUF1232 family)